jgi:hypothetical protein
VNDNRLRALVIIQRARLVKIQRAATRLIGKWLEVPEDCKQHCVLEEDLKSGF